MKVCNKCQHVHTEIPTGGKDHETGYYFQCANGCNSTLFIPSAASVAKITALKVKK